MSQTNGNSQNFQMVLDKATDFEVVQDKATDVWPFPRLKESLQKHFDSHWERESLLTSLFPFCLINIPLRSHAIYKLTSKGKT